MLIGKQEIGPLVTASYGVLEQRDVISGEAGFIAQCPDDVFVKKVRIRETVKLRQVVCGRGAERGELGPERFQIAFEGLPLLGSHAGRERIADEGNRRRLWW